MNAPSGLGIFIWQWAACEGGDINAIIAKAKRCGISWLAIHMTKDCLQNVEALKVAGFYVAGWSYCVPGVSETATWIANAVACRRPGPDQLDAILPDCEIEWESRKTPDGSVVPSDRRPEAKLFADQLRAALGDDCFIGNCGAWQWPDRHPIYPDHAFGSFWDAGMPERYWTMFSTTEPAKAALDESEKEWADTMNVGAYKALIPIGSAFDGSAQGGQPLRPADVTGFLDRQETCALWSWQHLPTTIWALLEQRAQAADVSPIASTGRPPTGDRA
jgi:hypothetical protein